MFFDSNKKKIVKKAIGSKAKYAQFLKDKEFTKEEKSTLLLASIQAEKNKLNSDMIENAYKIIVKSSDEYSSEIDTKEYLKDFVLKKYSTKILLFTISAIYSFFVILIYFNPSEEEKIVADYYSSVEYSKANLNREMANSGYGDTQESELTLLLYLFKPQIFNDLSAARRVYDKKLTILVFVIFPIAYILMVISIIYAFRKNHLDNKILSLDFDDNSSIPKVAIVLTIMFPGVGQLFVGKYLQGFLITLLSFIIFNISTALGWIIFIALMTTYTFKTITQKESYNLSILHWRQAVALASMIIPGLGEYLNGNKQLAKYIWSILGLIVVASIVTERWEEMLLLSMLAFIFSPIEAYILSPHKELLKPKELIEGEVV